ncbi:hypothetical protein Q8F55_008410 [Vanrija albida]|uniref:SIMPL domain-containing protein n=1 Tax=Vanrija albida TaxID=181172 RepID=A0ABR3PWA2_9TREE
MSNPPLEIIVSGRHSVQRRPQFCDIHITVANESDDAAKSFAAVEQTAEFVQMQIRKLAPPKEPRAAAPGTAPAPFRPGEGAKSDTESATSAATTYGDEDDVAQAHEWPPRHPEFPISTWSMARISTSTWVPYTPNGDGPRKYEARASFKASFHNLPALEALVDQIGTKENVRIDNLTWHLSPETGASIAGRIRRAAVQDAVNKAQDYAWAVSPHAKVVPIEIADAGLGGGGGGPRFHAAPMAAAAFKRSGGGGGEDRLSFEPEPVVVEASVTAKFVVQ